MTAGCPHALTQPGTEYFFSPQINQQKPLLQAHTNDAQTGAMVVAEQGTEVQAGNDFLALQCTPTARNDWGQSMDSGIL